MQLSILQLAVSLLLTGAASASYNPAPPAYQPPAYQPPAYQPPPPPPVYQNSVSSVSSSTSSSSSTILSTSKASTTTTSSSSTVLSTSKASSTTSSASSSYSTLKPTSSGVHPPWGTGYPHVSGYPRGTAHYSYGTGVHTTTHPGSTVVQTKTNVVTLTTTVPCAPYTEGTVTKTASTSTILSTQTQLSTVTIPGSTLTVSRPTGYPPVVPQASCPVYTPQTITVTVTATPSGYKPPVTTKGFGHSQGGNGTNYATTTINGSITLRYPIHTGSGLRPTTKSTTASSSSSASKPTSSSTTVATTASKPPTYY